MGRKFAIGANSGRKLPKRIETARRRSKMRQAAKLIFFAASMLGSGVYALHLFQSSGSSQQSIGNDITPQLMFILNERQVALQLQINYYSDYYPSAEELGFGDASGALPTGDREIQMQFIGGKPRSELQYAILLGQGAAESDPIAQQSEILFTGNPGSVIDADCTSPQTMGVTQVLYGRVMLDSQGNGSVDTIGRLGDQHGYLSDGTNNVVGLLDIVPPVTDIEPPGHLGQGCMLRLPDWPYLGGILWYSPSELSGEVTVGPVGANYRVDSAIPALANSSTLSWTINGPTAINYTLTNTALESLQANKAFWAGIFAALAAAFAVEVVNSVIGVIGLTAPEGSGEMPALTDVKSTAGRARVRSYLFVFLLGGIVLRVLIRLARRLAGPK